MTKKIILQQQASRAVAPFGVAIGIPEARPNRNVSTPSGAPVSTPGQGDRNTEVYTYFTIAGISPTHGTPILYNGDRQWANLTLTLETAGPVSVGTRADLFPVLSGKGELLITNVPMTFTIAQGYNRLYIAATGVNRVKVQIAPLPWLESISGKEDVISGLLQQLIAVTRSK